METRKKTKHFTITSSVIFLISFYLLKLVFDKLEWANNIELTISLLLSGVVAAFFTSLIVIYSHRRRIGVLFLLLYFAFILFLLILPSQSVYEIKKGDVWMTKEDDGENFILDFFSKDSVRIVFVSDGERVLRYYWNGSELKLFSEEGNLLFDWQTKFEEKKLTVSQGGDKLVFYKQ